MAQDHSETKYNPLFTGLVISLQSNRERLFPSQLYQEVKLRRESNMNAFGNKAIHSKVRQQPVHSSTSEWSDTPGLNSYSLDKESLLNKPEKESKDTRNKKKNHIFAKNNLSFENNKESEDSLGLKTTKNYTQDLNIVSKLIINIIVVMVKVTHGFNL